MALSVSNKLNIIDVTKVLLSSYGQNLGLFFKRTLENLRPLSITYRIILKKFLVLVKRSIRLDITLLIFPIYLHKI